MRCLKKCSVLPFDEEILNLWENAMESSTIRIRGARKRAFLDEVMALLPEGGNLNACLTCGLCASGCPATGIDGMDPRKFLRMACLGLDDEVLQSRWAWMCTMCQRCVAACPMKIDIPQLVFNVRSRWPKEEQPKGIRGSCEMAFKNETCSAMGAGEEDFQFVVEDVLEEYRETQPEFDDMQAPIDKAGAEFFLNQNSREPVTEPDEMVPLWKILHLAGADWTYGRKGWAAENYCLFCADLQKWEENVRIKARAVDDLGCRTWLNTE
jgi:heterodisulfide reductase subunit C